MAEIERCADDPAYAQVFMLTRTAEPLGNRRYWPIYAAAERHGLPIGLHVFGSGGHAYTGTGWPSYYIEEGAGHSTSCQTAVTSLVIEGVFERFPRLKVVMIEGGFAWLPALSWRLDKLFERMRSEVPHLKKKPSEYIRQHIWVTTQPMEEPQDRRQLFDIMEWIGWDRLLFASDYPHWDFDDPFRAFPAGLPQPSATSRSSPPTAARCTGSADAALLLAQCLVPGRRAVPADCGCPRRTRLSLGSGDAYQGARCPGQHTCAYGNVYGTIIWNSANSRMTGVGAHLRFGSRHSTQRRLQRSSGF